MIGELVPEEDVTEQTLAANDVEIVGYPADESVGAEGGRRRQIRNPETYPDAQQQAIAARSYADLGMSTLPMATQIGMTNQQR